MSNFLFSSLKSDANKLLALKSELTLESYCKKLEKLAERIVELPDENSDVDICERLLYSLPDNVAVFVMDKAHNYVFSKPVSTLKNKVEHYSQDNYKSLENSLCQEVVAYHKQKISSVSLATHEKEERRVGGRVYTVYWYSLLDSDNHTTYAVSVFIDITEHKIMQQASNEREKEHQSILNSLQQIVFHVDISGNLFFLNQAWVHVTGYSIDSCLGQNLFLFFKEDERFSKQSWFDNFLKSEAKNAYCDSILLTDSMHEKYVECQLQQIINESGNVKGAIGVITDVTQSQLISKKLHLQQIQQIAILKNIPDMLLIQSDDEVYIDAHIPNPKVALLEKNDFIGKSMQEVLPEWLYLKYHNAIEISRVNKQLQLFEYELEINKTKFFFESRVIAFPEKKFLSIIRDITDRVTIKSKVEETEERWNLALSATSDGIWDWNILDNKVFLSDEWKSMIGYLPNELVNSFHTWKNLVHPDDIRQAMIQVNNHLRGITKKFRCEHRLRCKNGDYKWILTRGQVIQFDQFDKPVRFVGTHTDISMQKETERELMQVNSTKDKFFSIISHDLRSPFNALIGFSEMLSENFEILPEQKKIDYVHYIHRISSSAFNLLENLLTWSRSQQGRLFFEPSTFNLLKVLNNQLESFDFYAKRKDIKIYEANKLSVDVYADFNMVETILRNLLSNAIKFSNRDAQITVDMQLLDGWVKMSVSDTGIGIPRKDAAKLFQINENYSTYGTDKEKGTGLGLILCKEFVEKNKGEIGVESELGKGTTFWFTLPLSTKDNMMRLNNKNN